MTSGDPVESPACRDHHYYGYKTRIERQRLQYRAAAHSAGVAATYRARSRTSPVQNAGLSCEQCPNQMMTILMISMRSGLLAIGLTLPALFSTGVFATVSAKTATSTAPEHDSTWQTIRVRRGGTLSGAFAKAGLGTQSWRHVLALGGPTQSLTRLHPGDLIRLKKNSAGELTHLRYRMGRLKTLRVDRRGGRLRAHIHKISLHVERRMVAGTVGTSLSGSLAAAGVPATIANKLSQVYRPRMDLSRHIQRGDQFRVLYKVRYEGGKRLGPGSLLAARFTVGKRKVRVFRFREPDGRVRYLNADGKSYKLGISRHPVNYTRISSPFMKERMDPAIHVLQPHNGTDMAAPVGTPVRAAANGTVKYIGWARGYGRVIYLRNFDGYTTRYAHLHSFAHGLAKGDHVKQGQRIGTVGNTGWSTGPHLLFEIRKNGVPHNPMTMPLPSARPLTGKQLAQFKKRIGPLVAMVDQPVHSRGYASVLGQHKVCSSRIVGPAGQATSPGRASRSICVAGSGRSS
ncbi:peptidoglycan DD-metalloendopeptidase family protein [Salinisphaera sp. SWV1]|uniref:M23 family metallopeptidase n=1 Tax=Salinisphaera sp. SWV1 TaxID=3454139 RepID=UPI003F857ABA